MTEVRIGSWTVEADPDQTRAVYARIERGGAETCACDPCANFAAARPACYPPGVLAAFAALGIEPRKEVEAPHFARLASGFHSYGVWFHFVGRLLSPARDEYEPVTPTVKWQVTERRDLVHHAFGALPVIQLDLVLDIPWTIERPEAG